MTRRLRDDQGGAFLVVEAILVAAIVLTAVLFFTSVQRPTAGSESRGVDLGPVAADTLGILQRRTFTAAATGDPEGWVTAVLGGDTVTGQSVEDFVSQVLPTGSKHFLRLSNGVGTISLLPYTSPGAPQGARASEVPLFPHWRQFAANEATDVASPGQYLSASNAVFSRFVDPGDTIQCIKGPANTAGTTLWRTATALTGTTAAGSTTVTGIASTANLELGMRVTGTGIAAGTKVAAIPSSTTVTLSAVATGTGTTSLSYYPNRIPTGALYGTWAGYTDAGCATAPVAYAVVVLPGAKVNAGLTWTLTSKTLTAAAATFSAADVGRMVVGAGIPGGTYVQQYNDTTHVMLSATPTVAGAATTATFASNPAYALYGLQLVVWFGA